MNFWNFLKVKIFHTKDKTAEMRFYKYRGIMLNK